MSAQVMSRHRPNSVARLLRPTKSGLIMDIAARQPCANNSLLAGIFRIPARANAESTKQREDCSRAKVVRSSTVVFVNRSAQGLAKAIVQTKQGNSTHGRSSDHIDSGGDRTVGYGDQPGRDKGSKSAHQHDGDALD